MSIQTQVLYGNRLYGQVTYSSNFDPETLNVTLSDSVAMVDSQLAPLRDDITLADSDVITATKALSDAVTMVDSEVLQPSKPLSDTAFVSDTTIVVAATKSITDFIRLKEWLSIQHIKAEIWTIQSAETDIRVAFTLYGRPLYGESLYSDAPTSSWIVPEGSAENFTNLDGEGNVP